jgi:hypothetical protein
MIGKLYLISNIETQMNIYEIMFSEKPESDSDSKMKWSIMFLICLFPLFDRLEIPELKTFCSVLQSCLSSDHKFKIFVMHDILPSSISVVDDIHGNSDDLLRIIEMHSDQYCLFLGDSVDPDSFRLKLSLFDLH